jgi:hypothetical protein
MYRASTNTHGAGNLFSPVRTTSKTTQQGSTNASNSQSQSSGYLPPINGKQASQSVQAQYQSHSQQQTSTLSSARSTQSLASSRLHQENVSIFPPTNHIGAQGQSQSRASVQRGRAPTNNASRHSNTQHGLDIKGLGGNSNNNFYPYTQVDAPPTIRPTKQTSGKNLQAQPQASAHSNAPANGHANAYLLPNKASGSDLVMDDSGAEFQGQQRSQTFGNKNRSKLLNSMSESSVAQQQPMLQSSSSSLQGTKSKQAQYLYPGHIHTQVQAHAGLQGHSQVQTQDSPSTHSIASMIARNNASIMARDLAQLQPRPQPQAQPNPNVNAADKLKPLKPVEYVIQAQFPASSLAHASIELPVDTALSRKPSLITMVKDSFKEPADNDTNLATSSKAGTGTCIEEGDFGVRGQSLSQQKADELKLAKKSLIEKLQLALNEQVCSTERCVMMIYRSFTGSCCN